MRLTDEAARQTIRHNLDETLVVEAAAGTGKTTELVNRIVRVLAEGRANVREIVAVTFTEKAAGELKLRLRQQLETERQQAASRDVAARLDEAVQNLEEAHVSTIHGFCADLLRERPVEARVDPLFRVLTEGQAERLFDEAFAGWFHSILEAPPEGVRRSLRRTSRGSRPGDVDEDGPTERLRRAAFDLAEWRDFRGAWTRERFERETMMTAIVPLVHALADVSKSPSYAGDNLFLDTEPVRRLSADLAGAPQPETPADFDGLESQLVDLRRNRDFKRGRKGSGPTYAKGVPRARVLEARDRLVQALDDFQLRADADLASLLHDELLECVDRYQRLKAREGALDFLDLLLHARDLVRDNTAVRNHFQTRFRCLFVDEFQDTDPLQAELLLLLASKDPGETRWHHVEPVPGKLFLVGDPKQSIYRFRRADVHIYTQVREQLVDRGATFVELRKSFRGVENLQRVINAAFAPVMDGNVETRQARYVPLERERGDHPAQPSVVVLPVPRPYAQRFISARAIEESLPDAVGAYIEWLVRHSGWTVTERRDSRGSYALKEYQSQPASGREFPAATAERPGAISEGHPTNRRVPIEARHICILFRRFVSYGEDVTRAYVDALEARGVKHLLVGGRAFHGREEIETLRAALMAIEWPDDQLSVFATLRGALFAIGDEELLEYHHTAGGFHPFRIPATLPKGLEPVRDGLTCLANWHRRRNRRPVAETISDVLGTTRAHVSFVLRPGGEQVLANVLHVAELARQYEIEGGMSFRGFVEALREAASGGQAAEAPILEEGSDGVRLMTVHKAKGLEFPVVILADITARLTPFDASRHIDTERERCALRIGGWSPKDLNDNKAMELLREEKEGERVAYVAATRARDLLVVPAVGDGPYAEGWVAPLNAAIYPPEDGRRVQAPAAGCPPFASRDSVLSRPDGDPATRLTVCPGRHDFTSLGGQYSVVWWSPEPALLSLGKEASFGLSRDDLIVKDVSPAVLRRHLDAHHAWKAERDRAIAGAQQPSIDVMTATAAASSADPLPIGDDIDVVTEVVVGSAAASAETVASRPGGQRFGSLVHALIADMPLDAADAHTIKRLASAHGRVLGADALEVAAAESLVLRLTKHPVVRAAARAARNGHCYREMPVTWRTSTGALIEGFVDLAYTDEAGVVVVDFKTDRELEGAADRYQRQVRIYAAAIAAATGLSARAVLLRL
jgi:ATP-dependent exoDNAse (exonuclease V) beta subunit